ncbi:hypothetical protein CcaverHIS002_0304490 [Cutaneotrichosporon cavernicola]|nr:hypothetical protein CcaverHIS002_0304490 [Cutaneotrichosporon cavernicola]
MAVHAPSAPVPVPAPASPSHSTRSDDPNSKQNGGWVSPTTARATSPPRINPQYLLHHGGSEDLLPPLPPHLQRLATGEANSDDDVDSDTSDDDSDVESDDEFQSARARSRTPPVPRQATFSSLSPSPPPQQPQRSPSPTGNENTSRKIMKKVSQVFRRSAKAAARLSPGVNVSPQRRSPVMQGPPPSPPLSDVGDNDGGGTDYAPSVAVTEATMDIPHPDLQPDSAQLETPERTAAPLMPVTEAGESRHALVDTPPPSAFNPNGRPESMTWVEEANGDARDVPQATGSSSVRVSSWERPPSAAYLGVASQRRVSSGSTSSRAGSLSMVRSGRLAPQRDLSPSPPLCIHASASADRRAHAAPDHLAPQHRPQI